VVIRRLLLHYKVLHILIVPKEPSSMFVTLMRKGNGSVYPCVISLRYCGGRPTTPRSAQL
jgi:hypothetical protein